MTNEERTQRMLKKGKIRIRELLQKNGGLMSLAEAAEQMESSELEVIQMAQGQRLIGLQIEGYWEFPVFQFESAEVLSGIVNLWEARPDESATSLTLFLLTRDGGVTLGLDRIREREPIELIAGGWAMLYEQQ